MYWYIGLASCYCFENVIAGRTIVSPTLKSDLSPTQSYSFSFMEIIYVAILQGKYTSQHSILVHGPANDRHVSNHYKREHASSKTTPNILSLEVSKLG